MSTRVFGILRVGTGDVALDAHDLQEVVRLERLPPPRPRAPAWSRGTLSLRGQPLPLVDLAGLLQLDRDPPVEPQASFVAVVAHRGARFGLCVTQIVDVIEVRPQQRHAVNQGDGSPLALTPSLIDHPNLAHPAYVLDLDALFALEEMVAVTPAATQPGHQSPGASTSPTVTSDATPTQLTARRWLIVESGGQALALDTAIVGEVANCPEIEPPPIELDAYLGNVTLRGARLPLFDPGALIGRAPQRTRPSYMVVLDGPEGRLALALEHVTALSASGTLSPAGPGQAAAVAGLVVGPSGRDALALDHRVLLSALNLSALARLHARLDGAQAGSAAAEHRPRRRFALVRFSCAGDYTTLLDQLDAVDAAPTDYLASGGDPRFVGVWRRHGRSVALVDLRRLLGRDASRPPQHVLIADSGQGLIGFLTDAVQRIDYIEAAEESLVVRWRGDIDPAAPAVERAKRLIALGSGERHQVMAMICLQGLAIDLAASSAALTVADDARHA
ncbi:MULTISPECIES: chemotaxis protein CheW [unclassified Modicisalibacter]|uniref:chemotaxis protein CheW n=1 Tax=unclassified Modicisalibacter TaxID=2679913 RepID=UPI001CCEA1CC|nr:MULTISPECIES: chemotaxis protein CheW [unclassified Modicisalibacter]MBZ9559324.1 chemotaxis protein CheW [Modicisalibacter sp. R2A 31.J]MBZ9576511.1 chemotaxis protein CheW [Modicisalibacter sp. MOD 31.J]